MEELDIVSVLVDSGTKLRDECLYSEAVELYRKALSIDPTNKVCLDLLTHTLVLDGRMCGLSGQVEEGIEKFKEALELDSHCAFACFNLGLFHTMKSEYGLALEYHKMAVTERPDYADAICCMSHIYGELGDFDTAFEYFDKCLAVSPNHERVKDGMVSRLDNHGVKCIDLGHLDQAVECFKKALIIRSCSWKSMINLSTVYMVQGEVAKAASMISEALRANHTSAEGYGQLGALHSEIGQISFAVEAYEHCLKLDPKCRKADQNKLMALNYIDEGHDDHLYEAHRDWGRKFKMLFEKDQCTSWDNEKDPERPLIIGYISPDFCFHPVSYFIEAPLVHHDYSKYKVVIYSAVRKADDKTTQLKDAVTNSGGQWNDIYGLDETDVAKRVSDDKIDILVELSGHTENNKLGVMACRPAPVQVTWIGYPNTTGLPTVDYRLTDILADPLSSTQKHVEKLIRLPRCFLCYTPEKEDLYSAPAVEKGYVTFGSFNKLRKISHRVLRTWARILLRVPDSRLVVKSKSFVCEIIKKKFFSTFEQLGVNCERIELYPWTEEHHKHMKAYGLMDVSLDTFPYAGTTTTCESLYMGVPCITMAGKVHAHNVGVSLLTNVGLDHLVAKDEDEYVELAVSLASDINVLSDLRERLRKQMLESPLCDGASFTHALEVSYREMWRRYCRGDGPSFTHSLEVSQLLESPLYDGPSITPSLANLREYFSLGSE